MEVLAIFRLPPFLITAFDSASIGFEWNIQFNVMTFFPFHPRSANPQPTICLLVAFPSTSIRSAALRHYTFHRYCKISSLTA